jgi:hypothetical protein
MSIALSFSVHDLLRPRCCRGSSAKLRADRGDVTAASSGGAQVGDRDDEGVVPEVVDTPPAMSSGSAPAAMSSRPRVRA